MKVNFKDVLLIGNNNKEYLTTASILSRITEEEIFRKYIKYNFKIGKIFNSPLRKDKHPSFNIFKNIHKKLLYKDFGDGTSGDCFYFIQYKYDISFIKALKLIDRDFCLGLSNTTINIRRPVTKHLNEQENNSVKKEDVVSVINIIKQPYTFTDYKYWDPYGVDFKQLKRFKIHSCKDVFLNNKRIFTYSKNNPVYAYQSNKQYKIYRPLASTYKWISNTTSEIIQGIEELSINGKLLIITKAMKDVLVLDQLGWNAIAPQNEGVKINKEVIQDFKERFDDIVILYDKDKAGIKAAKDLKKEHNIDYVFLPRSLRCKDISEVRKKHGVKITEDFLTYNLY